jgi:hypothetical protein
MFHNVFGTWKVLAKKPKPWKINLLLKLLSVTDHFQCNANY